MDIERLEQRRDICWLNKYFQSRREKKHEEQNWNWDKRSSQGVRGSRKCKLHTSRKQESSVLGPFPATSSAWGWDGSAEAGDIEQIKGGGVISHPRKDWTLKVMFKLLISRSLFSNEFVCTSPSHKRGVRITKPVSLPCASNHSDSFWTPLQNSGLYGAKFANRWLGWPQRPLRALSAMILHFLWISQPKKL